ncbi:hypothetical protein TWF192_004628 [Orbilia oligospora]|uniref:Uncharacterized protein n=1 Tax=Orbilia oligospora TaxID=2813651 RepID=A0A6G1MDI9_ORBOL|nr:hypothetical protein TWF191_002463 [Orbilia oligospora]KAF3252175.1 hypothetical protein TWF192_004628 [Orbilia oligospora]
MATTITIENLPTEIFLKVFGDIDKESNRLNVLSKTMRVCKQWKGIAEPLLYSRLYLDFCRFDLDDEGDEGDDEGNDDLWKNRVYKQLGDLSPHLFHERLFLRCAGFVRDLAIEFDDDDESKKIDIPNLTHLVKRTSPFKNITSLTCKGDGKNVSCKRLWMFLGLTESLFPRLQCLTIHRIVGCWNSGPGETLVRSDPTNSLAVGKRTGSLKEIKISLDVLSSDGHHVHELFGKIVETFGMEAAGLVSEVDVYFEDTGAVRRHRCQTGGLEYLKLNGEDDRHTFEKDWRVNNLQKLKYRDSEGLYLVPDLIFVDGGCFEKLRRLEVPLSTWFIWRDELNRIFLESPTSPVPFPNVEIFILDIGTAAEAQRIKYSKKRADDRWFYDLLDESLIFFPRLRHFMVGGYNTRRGYIERKSDGEFVIGRIFVS